MAKTYNTLGTVAPGDVLRANSGTASYNGLITNVNNYRVPPMCKVTLTADRTVTAGVAISWDTDGGTYGYDTDSMWSSGNPTRITLNTAGIYLLQASIQFTTAGGTISSLFGPTIILDGTTAISIPTLYNVNGAAGTYRAQGQAIYNAAAGKFFTIDFNPSGATGTLTLKNEPNTWFAATWLGQVS